MIQEVLQSTYKITFSGQGEIPDRWYSPRAEWHDLVQFQNR